MKIFSNAAVVAANGELLTIRASKCVSGSQFILQNRHTKKFLIWFVCLVVERESLDKDR